MMPAIIVAASSAMLVMLTILRVSRSSAALAVGVSMFASTRCPWTAPVTTAPAKNPLSRERNSTPRPTLSFWNWPTPNGTAAISRERSATTVSVEASSSISSIQTS
jgi:hypothetical protein